jgi:hypothetical protein
LENNKITKDCTPSLCNLVTNFTVGFPESQNCTNLIVKTDRLSKDAIFCLLADLEIETLTRAYKYVVAYHELPDAIVSDPGAQFVRVLWKRPGKFLRINRRLSTAFHPQTDGSTGRMNSGWEAYIRAFIK